MNTVNIMIAVVQRYDVRTQIGRLAKEGCKLRIVTTRDLIENWLQSPFKLPDGRIVDIDNDKVRTIITHDKVYAIHAKIHGKERYVVVTGTSNTTCGGLLYNDEMMLRLDGKWAFKTYSAHVADAFKHAHQSRVVRRPGPGSLPLEAPVDSARQRQPHPTADSTDPGRPKSTGASERAESLAQIRRPSPGPGPSGCRPSGRPSSCSGCRAGSSRGSGCWS